MIFIINIHQHSDYSNARGSLDCILKVSETVDLALELGLNGIALTDHDILSGHYKFLSKVKSINKKGLEILEQDPKNLKAQQMANFLPILGNEIYLSREGLNSETHEKGERFYHFILLAKDKIGWEQLNELSSRSWNRMYIRGITRTPTYISDLEEVVGKNPGHLIATTACLGGYLGQKIINFGQSKDTEERLQLKSDILNFIEKMRSIFHDNFYLEVQPNQDKDQIIYNQGLVAFGKHTNTKIIVAMDAHYGRPEDRAIHKAYLNSQEAERETDKFYQYTYLMSENEVIELLSTHLNEFDIINIINNTKEIKNKIQRYSIDHSPIIPKVPYENESEWNNKIHKYDNYEWFDIFSHSNKDNQFLLYKIIIGLEKFIEKKWLEEDIAIKRINEELMHIYKISNKLNQNMSTYFTTMQAMINKIWDVSIVAPGRGSAGAFLINYILEITQINPLDYDFPLWRFIEENKVSLADVDIDASASKRQEVFHVLKEWFESFNSNITNIATFGTEKSKSALITAARGHGLEPEEGLYFASLIPSERGFLWDLHDCYYGNEEKERKPIKEFIEVMNEFPQVWNTAQKIEGLINKRSIHAAGVAIFNDGKIYEQVALMKAPSGVSTTQFSLDDLEQVGVVKYDLLSTDAIDSIQTELYLLAEYGYIDWEKDLKTTYTKYLHPKVLEYNNLDMWKLAHDKKIISLFQFETPVGEQVMETIKPTSLLELANLNSVMRLMAQDGGELPIIQYKRRKENINLWYQEMITNDITKEEIEILEKHLLLTNGMCIDQESLMIMLQDPKIGNFSFMESDYARKVVAKKKMKEIEKLKEMFLISGMKNGNRRKFLLYVWDKAFAIQMGYSFSKIHTVSYSIIALQEMNLVHKYPALFWATSRLMVESGSIDFLDEDFDLLQIEQDDDDDNEENDTKEKNKTVNYFKMSSAIGKLRSFGIDIKLPDINKSNFTFKPDVENNTIYFGIKGLTRIGTNLIYDIIKHRPYISLEDFLSKVKVNKIQATMLIKAGAFDAFGEREKLLYNYCDSVADKKKKLTLQNVAKLIELNLIPEEMKHYQDLFKLTKHAKKYYTYGDRIVPAELLEYFQLFDFSDYEYEDNQIYIELSKWEKYYKKEMQHLKEWISKHEQELLNKVNSLAVQEMLNKYAYGNKASQEMEALSYYYSYHEMDTPEYQEWLDKMGVVDFFKLPEEPEIVWQKDEMKKFKLEKIVGTSIGRDKTKNIVGILTPTGFIKVKIYRSQFVKYDKQIKENGITEKSWFAKGSKLLLQGYRSGDTFIPKAYKGDMQPIHQILDVGLLKNKRLGE